MQAYFVSSHVHLCRTEDCTIVLDLRRNKYLALPTGDTDFVSAHVQGWPTASEGPAGVQRVAAESPLLRTLLREGLITDRYKHAQKAPPEKLPAAREYLFEDHLPEAPRITVSDVTRFVVSSLVASSQLRFRSLEATSEYVKARKSRKSASTTSSLNSARLLVAVFDRLRPLAFTSKDKCLFDSLALIEYLARANLYPKWVIGVRTNPFGAHSWVEGQGVVFNDLPENTRKYTPILVI
jgi:hypothetical protein